MTVHTAKGLEFPVVFVTGLEDGTFPHARALAEETELAEERRLAYVALTRARRRLCLTRAAVRSAWGAANAMPASRFLDDIPAEIMDWKRIASSMDALRGGSAGWGDGGFGLGRGSRGGRRAGTGTAGGSDDDDFGPAIGSGRRGARTGRLGRVETPKDRAEARRAKRLAARGKPVRLDGGERDAAQALPEAVAGLRAGDRVRHTSYGEGTVVGLEGSGRSTVARVEFVVDGAAVTKRLVLRLAPLTKI